MKLALPFLVTLVSTLLAVEASPSSQRVAEERQADLSQVKFFLYTRANQNSPDDIPFDFGDLSNTDFSGLRKTYFIIHGWNSDIGFTTEFKNELLANGDCNVFGIDWSALESWTNYIAAAQTSISVGNHVGEFAVRVMDASSLTHGRVHAIGHSLGAHAVGHLGRTVNGRTGSKIARVTGLDPAKPWFDVTDASNRMSKNDASFVDVIHSNSGALFDGCLSFPETLGHIDFYPAGGEHQPGCTEICTVGCTDNDLIDLIKGGCSHSRANYYFAESINGNRAFTATDCASWSDYESGACNGAARQVMGFNCNSSPGEGKYFLDVNESEPYAQG